MIKSDLFLCQNPACSYPVSQLLHMHVPQSLPSLEEEFLPLSPTQTHNFSQTAFFLVLVCMLCSLPAGFRQPCTFPCFHKHPRVISLYLQVRTEDIWVPQVNSAVRGHAICPKMYHCYSRDVFAHELKRKKRCLCIWLSVGCK